MASHFLEMALTGLRSPRREARVNIVKRDQQLMVIEGHVLMWASGLYIHLVAIRT